MVTLYTHRLGMVARIYNPSSGLTEPGRLGGQFWLHNEFKACLSYKVRPHLKRKKITNVMSMVNSWAMMSNSVLVTIYVIIIILYTCIHTHTIDKK